jgi:hypothetical protein
MSSSKFRRCHISCRIESVYVTREIISHSHFTATNGKHFLIHNMTAAYNAQTKEARIYAEFERVGENVIEDNMQALGAVSALIDSFSSDDWENASKIAFTSVVECGTKTGFSLFKHGTEPKAGIRDEPADGGYGGGAKDVQDDDAEQRPRPSGSDGEKNKRRRTVSPDGGGGGMDSSAVDLMKSIFEDSKRKNDDVTILKEKVLVNELTTKHQIALGEAALARTKLEAELEEEKAELQRIRQLMVMVRFHFIASII